MQLNVTGHHVDVTTSLKGYVEKKLDRIVRHSDHVIDVHCILTVEKLRHKAEATVLLNGAKVYADAVEQDMYAAIDALADKLDRRVKKHKEKLVRSSRDRGAEAPPVLNPDRASAAGHRSSSQQRPAVIRGVRGRLIRHLPCAGSAL